MIAATTHQNSQIKQNKKIHTMKRVSPLGLHQLPLMQNAFTNVTKYSHLQLITSKCKLNLNIPLY